MSCLEIHQVDLVALAACDALQCDQVGPPPLNQSANALHVGGIGIEDGIDIPGCPHYSMTNERDTPIRT